MMKDLDQAATFAKLWHDGQSWAHATTVATIRHYFKNKHVSLPLIMMSKESFNSER